MNSANRYARIPNNYISDTRLRIQAYRKIALALELADVKALRREFRDRFGKIPREVEILLQCAEVRIQAGDAHIETVETREDRIMLSQRGDPVPGRRQIPPHDRHHARRKLGGNQGRALRESV